MIAEAVSPVAAAARSGLTAQPKTLPPWLFYDELGTQLFEQITELPEYYLTRTERDLFDRHAEDIVGHLQSAITIVELGAGTAAKTGILLRAAASRQTQVLYQPIDVSPTALEAARQNIESNLPGVTVYPQIANYTADPFRIQRPPGTRILALYIGSSIGNFSPAEAHAILQNLRCHLQPGDALLLGTDLAPSGKKSVEYLLAAYNDAAGVTAAFNRNILARLNRELGADFNVAHFAHEARWNAEASRIEMHLVSSRRQIVILPADSTGAAHALSFEEGETIHTENSYKFTPGKIIALLGSSGFELGRQFTDAAELFAVSFARAV